MNALKKYFSNGILFHIDSASKKIGGVSFENEKKRGTCLPYVFLFRVDP